MLSEQAIKEFQKIYHIEYGDMLPFEEASQKAHSLLILYKAVHHPKLTPKIGKRRDQKD